jgi:muconolactone delta-isomerase
MTRQLQEYLQRAREAETRADSLRDHSQKRLWREIANGYRNLAQARLTNAEILEQLLSSPTSPSSSQRYKSF